MTNEQWCSCVLSKTMKRVHELTEDFFLVQCYDLETMALCSLIVMDALERLKQHFFKLNLCICIFQDTAMSKVWFKQDDKFFLPKACLNFEFFRYMSHL